MKKFLFFTIMLGSLGLFGQKTAKSAEVTPQLLQGTYPLHFAHKLDTIPNLSLQQYAPQIPKAIPEASSTWLSMVQCIIDSEGITCDELGCPQPEVVLAGTWKVVAEIGQRNGGWAYWVQGQSEPLLNYHNGILRMGSTGGGTITIQIWQQILHPTRLQIDDELILGKK